MAGCAVHVAANKWGMASGISYGDSARENLRDSELIESTREKRDAYEISEIPSHSRTMITELRSNLRFGSYIEERCLKGNITRARCDVLRSKERNGFNASELERAISFRGGGRANGILWL